MVILARNIAYSLTNVIKTSHHRIDLGQKFANCSGQLVER